MKGYGTDEEMIIDILTALSNGQRQQLKDQYYLEYDRDLVEKLKSELSGKFEDVIKALMMPPLEYLCKQLHKAMSGVGTDETALIEILCSKSNEEMAELVACYEDMYDRPLVEHICAETSGHFCRFLTLLVTAVRDHADAYDYDEAKEEAAHLYNAGESKLGTDEQVFYSILAHASFAQLRLIFDEYKELSDQTIEQAIKHELSGDLKKALLAMGE